MIVLLNSGSIVVVTDDPSWNEDIEVEDWVLLIRRENCDDEVWGSSDEFTRELGLQD